MTPSLAPSSIPEMASQSLVSTSRLISRMAASDLTPEQLDNFVTLERISSTLSLLGCLFIALTFLGSKVFHKPINRLVFYASMGNVFTNVATIISRSAVVQPRGGLCQFQAFLIQMFMPADAYWTLAMAVNVYLTFYWKFDAEALRRLEKYYILICYGAPFVPAFVYLWIQTPGKGHMYGNATLWCWVSSRWDVVRIYTFYGPVWVVIVLTTGIYIRTGREIYVKRKLLRSFNTPPPDPLPTVGDPFQSVKTTEVFVTTGFVEVSSSDLITQRLLNSLGPQCLLSAAPTKSNYTVTISTSQPNSRYSCTEKPKQRPNISSPIVPISSHMPNAERSNLHPARRYAAMEASNAAWGYTKVAVLFFIAMMVTWIASSANRVYSVCHPEQVSLGLEYASAFVLPLQGFWNALIYTTTSLPACKQLWRQIRPRKEMLGGIIGPNRKEFSETDSTTELASRSDMKTSSP